MKSKRNTRGAATALVVALSFVLTMLVVAFFQIALYFNGSDDTSNATDAGALNVAQQALTISTTAQTPDEHQFDDVADSNGNFTLTNINRVWGKALLAALNVSAMNDQGFGSSSANAHADSLFQAALNISNRLSGRLNTPSNHQQSFEKIAGQNAVNALGKDAKIKAANDENWKTSLVDRGSESNITFDKNQLPSSSQLQLIDPVAGQGGNLFIPGYKKINILGKSIYLVPFKEGERPQLISAEKFDSNTQQANPFDWKNAVPNAFSTSGKSINHDNLGQHAIARVQTNPQRTFDLLMPRAFIRIKLEKNRLHYVHNFLPAGEDTYQFHPEAKPPQTFSAGSGVAIVRASVGNEYVPATLFQAINALPADHSPVMNVLLQRCREIKKNFSEKDLISILQLPLVDNASEYVIFPLAKQIVAMPNYTANGVVPQLNLLSDADGDEKEIVKEHSPLKPNTASIELVGAGTPTIPPTAVTEEEGRISWKPGSGHGGCLGQLTIQRDTLVTTTGRLDPI
jgi:hypothetical protein